MDDIQKNTSKVHPDDFYALVRFVRSYAWELRSAYRVSLGLPVEAMLLPVFIGMLLIACMQIHSLPSLWWKLAAIPGIVFLVWAVLLGVTSLIRKIRDRRMEVRVVRICLERLTSVAETLTDLTFSETFLLNIVLTDARGALADCPR